MEFISPAYYTIATAEASANLARYDAVRYGTRAAGATDFQHMTNASRSSGFGGEVKLRIMLGSYVLRSGFQDRYYLRAQQIRRRLRREVAAVHQPQSGCDVLLLPTYPTLPFMGATDGGDPVDGASGGLSSLQQKQGDRFTCLSNLTGAPALSIPADLSEGLPVGDTGGWTPRQRTAVIRPGRGRRNRRYRVGGTRRASKKLSGYRRPGMSNAPQNGKYHVHIGLEIHSQMNTAQKIFCNCPTGFDAEPNRNVCPICLGYPGVLPHLNTQAMEKAYLVALALNAVPTTHTAFERKNYFYPDLPKNYQISQFAEPLGRGGRVDFFCAGEPRSIEFIEIHLEEDAGKMVHSGDCTLIDFNRTGTPLLEMVTKPQLRSGSEAESLLLLMRKIVRYLGVSDGNMEEGSLRCDANISLSPDGNLPDYKVELKNMNSARFVRLALEHEIARQTKLLDSGQRPTQETRLWNENRDVTIAMRSKEVAMDYRYFPEPDLPHFIASPEFLEKVKAQLVELPLERESRFRTQYKLTPQLAEQMTADIQTADYFESVLGKFSTSAYPGGTVDQRRPAP